MGSPDIVIAGAGIVGMACALECRLRGLRVLLLERGRAGQEASSAAAGMLAAHDPANPAALLELSQLSVALYPAFLERLAGLSGTAVPVETHWTLEGSGAEAQGGAVAEPAGLSHDGFARLREESLDPRKLVAVAGEAVRAAAIPLHEATAVQSFSAVRGGVEVVTSGGKLHCGQFVDCTGAWSGMGVRPAKGQMLRLFAPGALACGDLGNVVVRTPGVYLVPRLDGSVVIGATVEDAGFDKTPHQADALVLRGRAEALLPSLKQAPMLEHWAGLRPATADGLPLLGPAIMEVGDARVFVAAGHFRNGVLLAPATAHVMAQLLLSQKPSTDLNAFAPYREAIAGSPGLRDQQASDPAQPVLMA